MTCIKERIEVREQVQRGGLVLPPANAERVLNVDGYSVLAQDRCLETVMLDVTLVRRGFGVD